MDATIIHIKNDFQLTSINLEIIPLVDEEKLTEIFNDILDNYALGSISFSQKRILNRLVEALPIDKMSQKTLLLALRVSRQFTLNQLSSGPLLLKYLSLEGVNENAIQTIEEHASCLNGAALVKLLKMIELAEGIDPAPYLVRIAPLAGSVPLTREESLEVEMLQKNYQLPLISIKTVSSGAPRSREWAGMDDKQVAAAINRWNKPFVELHELAKRNQQDLSWFGLLAYCRKLVNRSRFDHKESAELINARVEWLTSSQVPSGYDAGAIAQLFGATAPILKMCPALEKFLLDHFPHNTLSLSDNEMYMISLGIKDCGKPEAFMGPLEASLGDNLHLLSKRKIISFMAACGKGENTPLFNRLIPFCRKHISHMNPKELREVIEAVGVCKKYTLRREYDPLISSCLKRLSETLPEPKEYALISGSLAKCNYADAEWNSALLKEMEKGSFFTWYEILIFYSWAALGISNEKITQLLTKTIKGLIEPSKGELEKLYTLDLMQLIWSVAFHLGNSAPELSAPLIDEALKRQHNETDQLMLRTAIELCDYPIEGVPGAIIFASEESFNSSFTQTELVGEALKKALLDKGVEIIEEHPVGFYRVDFFFPNVTIEGKRLILEVDGPYHFTVPGGKYDGSSQMKSRYLNKKGYHLVRMKVSGYLDPTIDEKVEEFIAMVNQHGLIAVDQC